MTEPEPELILEDYYSIKEIVSGTDNFLTQAEVNELGEKVMNGFKASKLRLDEIQQQEKEQEQEQDQETL